MSVCIARCSPRGERHVMPELRKDPVVDRWVIIAPDRARRPIRILNEAPIVSGELCPFCEGNESHTPPEILACRDPGTKPNERGWHVRVVPNQFPALQIEGDLDPQTKGMYQAMNGVGSHEVIVECPHHEISMANLPVDRIREVLGVYRDRLIDLKKDRRLVYGTIFKNVGLKAGASMEHSHSQLIATPILPATIQEEINGSCRYFDQFGRCVYCDMIQEELALRRRIVSDAPGFICFTPFASRFPYEAWIVPKSHASHYENIQQEELDELAMVLKKMLLKLDVALDKPSYNYIIHTSPFDAPMLPHCHWRMEIIPRLTQVAGFEWGTGFFINPMPPEDAAAYFRDVEVDVTSGR